MTAVAFSPAGDLLATGGDEGVVRLWDPRSGEAAGEPLGRLDAGDFPPPVTSLAFSGDGAWLAASWDDGPVLVWDRSTRLPLGVEPIVMDGGAAAVVFGPHGLFAVGGRFGALQIFRRADRGTSEAQPELRFFAAIDHDDGIADLVFHPQLSLLAVARSSSVEVVDLQGIHAWEAQACERVLRTFSGEEWNRLIGPDFPREDLCPASPGSAPP